MCCPIKVNGKFASNFGESTIRPYINSRERYSAWCKGKDVMAFHVPAGLSCLVQLSSQQQCVLKANKKMKMLVLRNTEYLKKRNFPVPFFFLIFFLWASALIMTFFFFFFEDTCAMIKCSLSQPEANKTHEGKFPLVQNPLCWFVCCTVVAAWVLTRLAFDILQQQQQLCMCFLRHLQQFKHPPRQVHGGQALESTKMSFH